jgi:hypothetical protein
MKRNILLATLRAISSVAASGKSIMISPSPNNLIALAVLLATINAQAGSLKMPASPNLTRNAGQDIPVSFTGSGWPIGQKAQVYLVSTKTWAAQLVWADQPVKNGSNQLNLPIPWSWIETGRYVVKIVCGNTQATGTGVVTIRSAVIWPYGGTVWHPGQAVAVTCTAGVNGDFVETILQKDNNEAAYNDLDLLGYWEDTQFNRYNFIVPLGVVPGTYRIHINWYNVYPMWDDETDSDCGCGGGPYWHFEPGDSTRSEKITIQ